MSHTVCVQRATVTAEACLLLMVHVKTSIKICSPFWNDSLFASLFVTAKLFMFYFRHYYIFDAPYNLILITTQSYFSWSFFFLEHCRCHIKRNTVNMSKCFCVSEFVKVHLPTVKLCNSFLSCKSSLLMTSTNTHLKVRGLSFKCSAVCLWIEGFKRPHSVTTQKTSDSRTELQHQRGKTNASEVTATYRTFHNTHFVLLFIW